MKIFFSHERLNVYQASIRLITLVSPIIEKSPKRLAVVDQLDRASTSIPLNIAEGNGRYTPPDRCRFFDAARGSALECSACLDVLAAKNLLSANEAEACKALLCDIVNMLVGLIRAVDSSRVAEDAPSGFEAFSD